MCTKEYGSNIAAQYAILKDVKNQIIGHCMSAYNLLGTLFLQPIKLPNDTRTATKNTIRNLYKRAKGLRKT